MRSKFFILFLFIINASHGLRAAQVDEDVVGILPLPQEKIDAPFDPDGEIDAEFINLLRWHQEVDDDESVILPIPLSRRDDIVLPPPPAKRQAVGEIPRQALSKQKKIEKRMKDNRQSAQRSRKKAADALKDLEEAVKIKFGIYEISRELFRTKVNIPREPKGSTREENKRLAAARSRLVTSEYEKSLQQALTTGNIQYILWAITEV